MIDVTNVFSARLKELRGERTLQEVANEIGITRVALGYYEKGERKPDIEILYRIADFYKVSSDYLIGISDVKTQDIEIKGIASKTGLSEKNIEKICNFNERLRQYIEPLNLIIQSLNFTTALHYASKYIQDVKILNILDKKRNEQRVEAFSEPDGFVNGKPVYNWPFTDELDEHYKKKENEKNLNEYFIDKAFKHIIQELERVSKTE